MGFRRLSKRREPLPARYSFAEAHPTASILTNLEAYGPATNGTRGKAVATLTATNWIAFQNMSFPESFEMKVAHGANDSSIILIQVTNVLHVNSSITFRPELTATTTISDHRFTPPGNVAYASKDGGWLERADPQLQQNINRLSGQTLLSPPEVQPSSSATDPVNRLQCRMDLMRDSNSVCAHGVYITLTNLSAQEAFSLDVAKDIRETFLVWINTGPRPLSNPVKFYSHHKRQEYSVVKIPPLTAKTWAIEFADVINTNIVNTKLFTNCLVYVNVVTHRRPPVKLLSVYETNVCVVIP